MSSEIVGVKTTEIEAALRVMGDTLEPTYVTAVLGVAPDRSCRKGDPRSKPHYAPYSHGLWLRNSRADAQEPLDNHLEELLRFCRTRTSGIKTLQEKGWDLDISVGIFSSDINIEFYLSSNLLSELGAMGLALKFDNYLSDEV